MSPASALASEVFRFYLIFVGALLALAGALLAALRWGLGRDVRHAWAAWRGWAAMVPVLATCLFLGRAATIALFSLVSLVAFRELARATGLHRDRAMTNVAYL